MNPTGENAKEDLDLGIQNLELGVSFEDRPDPSAPTTYRYHNCLAPAEPCTAPKGAEAVIMSPSPNGSYHVDPIGDRTP